MQIRRNMVLTTVGVCTCVSCGSLTGPVANQTRGAANAAETPSPSTPKTFLLAVGKARAADPARQQERAIVAVCKIADAAKRFQPTMVIDALTETIMTREQFWRGETEAKVNGAILRERLQNLAQTVTAHDTVIIYTHSHGTWGSLDASQPLGGMALDPGTRRPAKRGVFPWDEYSDLILDIPAKNVVVLTMSCFSGGLVEYLNSPMARDRWKDRRENEGRNLIVLTSQSRDLPSPPIVKADEIINPFTYAVAEALSGKADGFVLVNGKPDKTRHRDGTLSVGEIIDFILYTTEKTVSQTPRRHNTAKPQLTGSFDRNDALLTGGGATGARGQHKNDAQRDAASDVAGPGG